MRRLEGKLVLIQLKINLFFGLAPQPVTATDVPRSVTLILSCTVPQAMAATAQVAMVTPTGLTARGVGRTSTVLEVRKTVCRVIATLLVSGKEHCGL